MPDAMTDRRLSEIIDTIAPVNTKPDVNQLPLFPNLRCLSPQPSITKSIQLPRSVLVIKSDEQLTQYLSRVAAAAVIAATKTCGSPQQAAVRLGTADQPNEDRPGQDQKPTTKRTLRLASRNP